MKTIKKSELEELIQRVVRLHNDLMNAGIYKTGHKMHEVVKEIGYETAEILSFQHPTKLAEAVLFEDDREVEMGMWDHQDGDSG